MKDVSAYSVEKKEEPSNIAEAASMFSLLAPEAQDKIIDLIKSLLSRQ